MTPSPKPDSSRPADAPAPAPDVTTAEPAAALASALAHAAAIAHQAGVDLDGWMRAAWSAYVDARPGLRQHLEDLRLQAELAALRDKGRMPEA